MAFEAQDSLEVLQVAGIRQDVGQIYVALLPLLIIQYGILYELVFVRRGWEGRQACAASLSSLRPGLAILTLHNMPPLEGSRRLCAFIVFQRSCLAAGFLVIVSTLIGLLILDLDKTAQPTTGSISFL